MSWHIRFKPKPIYLRDKLELWIIRISDGGILRYNLLGLFPFIGIPIGALFGAIVSFVIDSRPETGWHEGVRQSLVGLAATSDSTAHATGYQPFSSRLRKRSIATTAARNGISDPNHEFPNRAR